MGKSLKKQKAYEKPTVKGKDFTKPDHSPITMKELLIILTQINGDLSIDLKELEQPVIVATELGYGYLCKVSVSKAGRVMLRM
jgi:hypothetical protein